MKTKSFSIYLFLFIILLPFIILIIKLNYQKTESFETIKINNQMNLDLVEQDVDNKTDEAPKKQGKCKSGYYDITNGNPHFWWCGRHCRGGKYLTDGACNCACVPIYDQFVKVEDTLKTNKLCIEGECITEDDLKLAIEGNDVVKNKPIGGFDNFIKSLICVKNTKESDKDLVCLDPNELNYFKNMWPIGSIVSYNGDINDIPNGWLICDGNNGTPDLSDRFIRGDYDVNKKGFLGNYVKDAVSIEREIDKTDISKVKNLGRKSWEPCRHINGPCPDFCGEGGNCRLDWPYDKEICSKYKSINQGHYCVPLKDKELYTFDECKNRAIKKKSTYFGIQHLDSHEKDKGYCYLFNDEPDSEKLITNENEVVFSNTKNQQMGNSSIISIYKLEDVILSESEKNNNSKNNTPTDYKQGPCNPGYYDKTNGNYKWWACGAKCEGGKFYTDGGCNCACQKIPEPEHKKGGVEEHTLKINELPEHTHKFYTNNNKQPGGTNENNGIAAFSPLNTTAFHFHNVAREVGAGKPLNIMPPYHTLYYIMRTDTKSSFSTSKSFDSLPENSSQDLNNALRDQIKSYGKEPLV